MAYCGFIGQLARCPGINGAFGVGGRGTGKGNDLDDLFGREGGRRAGPRRIGENLDNEGAQRRVVGFYRSKVGRGGCPAASPCYNARRCARSSSPPVPGGCSPEPSTRRKLEIAGGPGGARPGHFGRRPCVRRPAIRML